MISNKNKFPWVSFILTERSSRNRFGNEKEALHELWVPVSNWASAQYKSRKSNVDRYFFKLLPRFIAYNSWFIITPKIVFFLRTDNFVLWIELDFRNNFPKILQQAIKNNTKVSSSAILRNYWSSSSRSVTCKYSLYGLVLSNINFFFNFIG